MHTVSVIIPTFNRAQRIGPTIESVISQKYPDIEIIVVDDGSTDDTAGAIAELTRLNGDGRKKIRYIRQVNNGACAARNRGLMLATGTYVMFLDSDDLIQPEKISVQVEQMEAEGTSCSICEFEFIDPDGKVLKTSTNNHSPHDFIRKMISPHISTILMRRDSMPPGLQWDVRLKRIQDMDFAFKYFLTVARWSYTPKPLFTYCLHRGERISDSYRKGFQYSILKNSFSSYARANLSFCPIDVGSIQREYWKALSFHRFRNAVSRATPRFLKNGIKKLSSIR